MAPTPESHLQSVKLGQHGYNQMEELPSGPSGGSNNGAELVHDHCGPCPADSPQFMHQTGGDQIGPPGYTHL